MKKWFLTNSNQIIDLNLCKEFWVEEIPEMNKVFCKCDDDIEWTIAIFPEEQQAVEYLNDIYSKLTN